jgi:hypothetical protein
MPEPAALTPTQYPVSYIDHGDMYLHPLSHLILSLELLSRVGEPIPTDLASKIWGRTSRP